MGRESKLETNFKHKKLRLGEVTQRCDDKLTRGRKRRMNTPERRKKQDTCGCHEGVAHNQGSRKHTGDNRSETRDVISKQTGMQEPQNVTYDDNKVCKMLVCSNGFQRTVIAWQHFESRKVAGALKIPPIASWDEATDIDLD